MSAFPKLTVVVVGPQASGVTTWAERIRDYLENNKFPYPIQKPGVVDASQWFLSKLQTDEVKHAIDSEERNLPSVGDFEKGAEPYVRKELLDNAELRIGVLEDELAQLKDALHKMTADRDSNEEVIKMEVKRKHTAISELAKELKRAETAEESLASVRRALDDAEKTISFYNGMIAAFERLDILPDGICNLAPAQRLEPANPPRTPWRCRD